MNGDSACALAGMDKAHKDLADIHRAIIASMPDGVLGIDDSAVIRICNPAAERMFGWPSGDLVGQSVEAVLPLWRQSVGGDLVPPSTESHANRPDFRECYAGAMGRRQDGTEFPLSVSTLEVPNDLGLAIVMIRDISDLIEEIDALKRLANTDVLSGLPNRRGFAAITGHAIAQAHQTGQPFSVMMIDLDHFKEVNDRFGHEGGDLIIRALPGVLKAALREHDSVARWGGEEFIVLLPQTAGAYAGAAAERMRATIAATPFAIGDVVRLALTASIGVASCSSMTPALDAIIRQADHALYAAKLAGRNCVRSAAI